MKFKSSKIIIKKTNKKIFKKKEKNVKYLDQVDDLTKNIRNSIINKNYNTNVKEELKFINVSLPNDNPYKSIYSNALIFN